MCGRFAQRTPPKRLTREFKVGEVPPVEARYNIAPTQDILAVHEAPDGREATFLKWGLVPTWAKDTSMGARLINARAETVAEKPAFRQALRQRRCIIPADGFYEWQRTGGRKQPFFFRMRDERPFGFAGLWERWEGEEGQAVNSCTILTTEANDVLRPVHDRMPVILHPEDYSLWLEGDEREQALLREMLRPYPAEEMVGHPVSTLVNSPGNKGPELIEEIQLNSV
jgi:putative SOS response-associated peptidase YedK